MRQSGKLTNFAAIYCDVILLDALLRMRDYFANGFLRDGKAVPVWLLFAAGIYLFNSVFLKKERSLTSVAAANILIGIPEFVLLYRCSSPVNGFWAFLFLLAAAAAVHARIVNRFFEPVSIDSSIRFFEMSVVEYLILKTYQSFAPIGGSLEPFLISAVVISLAAVIAGRVEGAGNADAGAGKGGLLAVGGILGGAAAVCLIFAGFFSDSAGNLIARTASLIMALVRGAGHLFERFLNWLFSLFPVPDTQPIEMPEPVSMGNVEIPEAAEISSSWIKYLGIAGGVLAFALLLFILYKLRKTKAASLKVQVKTQASARGGLDLKEMIGRILKGIRQSLERKIRLVRIRNTVPGLALTIENTFRGSSLEKRESESYSAFLRRIADAAGQNELARQLQDLASDFEEQYYAGGEAAVCTAAEAGSIRRGIRSIPAERKKHSRVTA